MGTESESNAAYALFGKTRREVLALLFSHSDEPFYLRQILRSTTSGQGAVQRELEQLVQVDLIVRRKQGNQVFFQANSNSPIFPELHRLIMKTLGAADVLKDALGPLMESICVSFIYGSVARGSEKADSDVDVMVVGNVDFGDLVKAVRPAQDKLHREVNPSVYSPDEFRRRIQADDHFITTVLEGEKIFLIGDEDVLRKLG